MLDDRRTAASPDPSLPPPQLTGWGVGITVLAYLALAAFYVVTIAWTGQEPIGSIIGRVTLDYAIKGVLTVPLWWGIVRRLDGLGWKRLLAVHALAALLFVSVFYHAYYGLLPVVGLSGLPTGFRQWDVYISTLFYIIQFGAFHTVRYVQQLNAQAEREKELIDLAREREMAALKAQLNPHFLFNAFNTISASVPPEARPSRRRWTIHGRPSRGWPVSYVIR